MLGKSGKVWKVILNTQEAQDPDSCVFLGLVNQIKKGKEPY